MKISRIVKKFITITICVLIPVCLISSCFSHYHNAKNFKCYMMPDFYLRDQKLSFTLLANAALDYYEEAKNSYSDLKRVTIYYYSSTTLEISYKGDETLLATKEVEDAELVAAYRSVEEAICFPDQRKDEPFLYIRVTEKQVDFSNGYYNVTYRSDLKKPDTDRYYVLRLSGLHWYHTYDKDAS